MFSMRHRMSVVFVAAMVLMSCACAGRTGVAQGPATASATDAETGDTRYKSVILRGTLSSPSLSLAGARVRCVSLDEDGETVEGVVNENGEFVLDGLRFTNYVVEIVTADGERIQGVNWLPVTEDTLSVTLKVSDRIVSTTTLENQPTRFAAVVNVEPRKWRKFWMEFAIFFGAAAGLGLAAL